MFDIKINGDEVLVKPYENACVVAATLAGRYRRQRLGPKKIRSLTMSKARATDPQTSHDAGDSVSDITETQSYILRVLSKKPRNDSELIAAYRNFKRAPMASESGIRSRRSELVKLGSVTDTGERVVLPSGRRSIVWGLSS